MRAVGRAVGRTVVRSMGQSVDRSVGRSHCIAYADIGGKHGRHECKHPAYSTTSAPH